MSEVRFSNNNDNFKNFVKEAINISNETSSIENKIQKLESNAQNNDGFISTKERLIVQAFKEKPSLINDLNKTYLDKEFFLDIKENPIKNKLEPKDTVFDFASSNPLGAITFDPGISIINAGVEALNANPEEKLNITLNRLGNKQISDKVNSFISSLDNNSNKKYASAYISELIENREPKLSTKEIINLLDKIDNISKSDYPEAVGNSQTLALSALHDISVPSDVSQNNTGGCVATSAQIQMIVRSPSNYLVMLDKLAKNENYETAKGSIAPNWTFSKPFDFTARTISSSIVQSALMSVARNGNYDNTKIDSVSKGLFLHEAKNMYEKMLGTSVTTKSIRQGISKDDLFQSIANAKPSKINPVHITMIYTEFGRDRSHAVNIIGLDSNNVKIINPWGREETFKTQILKERLLEALIVNKK